MLTSEGSAVNERSTARPSNTSMSCWAVLISASAWTSRRAAAVILPLEGAPAPGHPGKTPVCSALWALLLEHSLADFVCVRGGRPPGQRGRGHSAWPRSQVSRSRHLIVARYLPLVENESPLPGFAQIRSKAVATFRESLRRFWLLRAVQPLDLHPQRRPVLGHLHPGLAGRADRALLSGGALSARMTCNRHA
jgi:hypothetical protein